MWGVKYPNPQPGACLVSVSKTKQLHFRVAPKTEANGWTNRPGSLIKLGMGRLNEKIVDNVRILGFSMAGEETVIAVPEYNVCFDIGRAPREAVTIDNVCLSHGHMDHAAGIAYYFSQRGFIGAPPGRVFLPRILADPVKRLMNVWAEIEGHHSPGEVVAVEPLKDVKLRRNLIVRPFSVNHAGGALGFTLIEQRHKLKPEFHGKTGPQLAKLKMDGVKIENDIEMPIVTYTGDTATGRFIEHDFVRASRVLIIECTFYEKDHKNRASAGRHMHVDDLPKVLEAIPDAKVLLTHLTRRTELRFAKETLKRVVGEAEMERIAVLMERPPRGDRRRR